MTPTRRELPSALLLCCFLAPLCLQAQLTTLEIGSSPNPVGSGARAMGQGNAFIAVADDATCASWNPGGLSHLEAPEVSFAVEALSRREDLSSRRHPEAETGGSLALQDLNYASVVYPFFFRGRNMAMSLSYLKLYRFDKAMSFPYANIGSGLSVAADFDFDQEGEFSVLAPAFGVDVTDYLSLGVALNLWHHGLTGSSSFHKTESLSGTLAAGSLESTFSHVAKNRFEVREGYSIVLGGLYQVSKTWRVGAVVKPRYTLRLDHELMDTYFQEGDLGTTPGPIHNGAKDDAELRFPWIVGAGAAWQPRQDLTLAADATWTQWSRYRLHERGRDTNPLTGELVSTDELDDTFTLRVGAECLFIFRDLRVPLSCGLGYDPSPAVGDVDDFYTVSLGTGLQLGAWNLDLAYEFRWGNEVHGDTLRGLGATQDVKRHRVLASLIVYF